MKKYIIFLVLSCISSGCLAQPSKIIRQSTKYQARKPTVQIQKTTPIKHTTTRKIIVKKSTPVTVIKKSRASNRAIVTTTTQSKRSTTLKTTNQSKPVKQKTSAKSNKIYGKKYRVRGKTYRILKTSKGYGETGIASWYGKPFHGRKTANGEIYNMHHMTAAHKSLPLGTYVTVKNLSNNKKIKVRINDRGPFVDKRIIDLSYAAAKKLGIANRGVAKVEVKAIS